MARPRQFDRDEVLDAALELFWQRGYGATTTRDLESSLGLNQSSIYNAYGSKRGLLDAALDRYESRLDVELMQPLARGHGLAAIEQFFDRLLYLVTDNGRRGCLLVGMMAEDAGESRQMVTRTRAYRARVRRGLTRALDQAVELGETAAGANAERAQLLLAVILGLNIAARGGASRAELARMLASVHCQLDHWRTYTGTAPNA